MLRSARAVAMCYQLGDRVVDELIDELEAIQHA